MISLYFVLAQSVSKITFSKLQNTVKTGKHFILAISSDSYNYYPYVQVFVKSAHQIRSNDSFYILDVSVENVDAEMLNISSLPALISYENGNMLKYHVTVFDTEHVMGFFNSNSFPSIKYIENKSQLPEFQRKTTLGLICTIKNPSTFVANFFESFNKEHFNEVTVAFSDSSLFNGVEGFFVYRFLDHQVVPLGDISSYSEEEIVEMIIENSVPLVHKLDSFYTQFFENEKQRYMILSYPLDGFYLNEEASNEAISISKACSINVSYATFESSDTYKRLGFPSNKGYSMAIVDHRGKYPKKYLMSSEISIDSATKFCGDVESNKHPYYWKSQNISNQSSDLLPVSSNSLRKEASSSDALVMAVYYASDDCLAPLVNVSKDLKNIGLRFAKFALAYNDWSGEDDVDFSLLPQLIIYKKGKLLHHERMGNTTELVITQIHQVLEKNKEL